MSGGVTILAGSCMDTLPTIEAGSVSLCLTSPPYFALRSYLPANHPDKHREIGSEPTPEAFIASMVAVFREVRRTLRDDGILVCNLGDSYAGSGKGPTGENGIGNQERRQGFSGVSSKTTLAGATKGSQLWQPILGSAGKVDGAKPKDLLMLPFRVAMALQADGWFLRSVIPWVKRNPMPESVRDRPASAVEYLFLLSKSRRYRWDADAIKFGGQPYAVRKPSGWDTGAGGHGAFHRQGRETSQATGEVQSGRSYRNSDAFFQSWQGLDLDMDGDPLALIVNPLGLSEAHFATFPPKLVEPFVKAGTAPDDIVLDPFGGAGTVGLVASRLGRAAILCELNPEYAEIARRRIDRDAPLFSEPVTLEQPLAVQSDLFDGFDDDARQQGARALAEVG